jgi:hypothetical protein
VRWQQLPTITTSIDGHLPAHQAPILPLNKLTPCNAIPTLFFLAHQVARSGQPAVLDHGQMSRRSLRPDCAWLRLCQSSSSLLCSTRRHQLLTGPRPATWKPRCLPPPLILDRSGSTTPCLQTGRLFQANTWISPPLWDLLEDPTTAYDSRPGWGVEFWHLFPWSSFGVTRVPHLQAAHWLRAS